MCKAGTELTSLLEWFGIKHTPECLCAQRAKIMDKEGCQWTLDNINIISFWIKGEAAQRKLPCPMWFAKLLIKYAVKRAKKL